MQRSEPLPRPTTLYKDPWGGPLAAYTQINTVTWDLRGNQPAQDPPMTSNSRFPMPNPSMPPQMRQTAPTYPTPFAPLGLPTASQRVPAPNTHASYNTFPRSAFNAQLVSGTSSSRGVPGPPPRAPTTRSVPVNAPSHHHSSSHHHSHRHHHSHTVSAATTRHVHYVDDPRPRHLSAQGSQRAPVPVPAPAPPPRYRTLSTHAPQPVVPTAHTHQSTHGHRTRANSMGNSGASVIVNVGLPPSQQQVRVQHGRFEHSQCTGRKKALCVGINYIGQKRELHGCINDIKNVKRFLTTQWGFKDGDIVMLMDQTTNPRQMPTRQNMIDGMQWLVKDARPHDSLFFHYSGHGGQIPDTHGDKTDGFDEVIYPVDYKTAGVLIDDELHRLMVKPLPPGCRLTAVFDSCHSGTALDLPYIYHHDGSLKTNHIAESARPNKKTSADVISFAACRDDQTSADTVEGGVAVGAMSYAFLASLTRKPVQSYLELLLSIREIVQKHYQQKAQLSSGHRIDTNIQFIL